MNAKSFISTHIDELSYQVDKLREHGANEELLGLLNRVVTIGSVSILYGDELGDSELDAVVSSVKLAEAMITPENENDIEKNSEALRAIIERMEALFRSKQLLLDSEEKKIS